MGGLVSRRKRAKVEARSISTQATEGNIREESKAVESQSEVTTDATSQTEKCGEREFNIGDGFISVQESQGYKIPKTEHARSSNEDRRGKVLSKVKIRPRSNRKGQTQCKDFSTQFDFHGLPGQVSPDKDNISARKTGSACSSHSSHNDPHKSVGLSCVTRSSSQANEKTEKVKEVSISQTEPSFVTAVTDESQMTTQKQPQTVETIVLNQEAFEDENCNIVVQGSIDLDLQSQNVDGPMEEVNMLHQRPITGTEGQLADPPSPKLSEAVNEYLSKNNATGQPSQPLSEAVNEYLPKINGTQTPEKQVINAAHYQGKTVQEPPTHCSDSGLKSVEKLGLFHNKITCTADILEGATETTASPGITPTALACTDFQACWDDTLLNSSVDLPHENVEINTEKLHDSSVGAACSHAGQETMSFPEHNQLGLVDENDNDVCQEEDIAEDTLDWNVDDRVRSPSDSRSDHLESSDDNEDNTVDILKNCGLAEETASIYLRQNSLTTLKDGDSAVDTIYMLASNCQSAQESIDNETLNDLNQTALYQDRGNETPDDLNQTALHQDRSNETPHDLNQTALHQDRDETSNDLNQTALYQDRGNETPDDLNQTALYQDRGNETPDDLNQTALHQDRHNETSNDLNQTALHQDRDNETSNDLNQTALHQDRDNETPNDLNQTALDQDRGNETSNDLNQTALEKNEPEEKAVAKHSRAEGSISYTGPVRELVEGDKNITPTEARNNELEINMTVPEAVQTCNTPNVMKNMQNENSCISADNKNNIPLEKTPRETDSPNDGDASVKGKVAFDKDGKIMMNFDDKTLSLGVGKSPKSLLEMQEAEAMTLLLLTGTLPGENSGSGVIGGAGDALNLDAANGTNRTEEEQVVDEREGIATMLDGRPKSSCQLEQLQVENCQPENQQNTATDNAHSQPTAQETSTAKGSATDTPTLIENEQPSNLDVNQENDDSSNHGCPPNRLQQAVDDSSNHGCPPNRLQQAVDDSSNHGCPPNRIQQAVDDRSNHGCPPNRIQQAVDDRSNDGCPPNRIQQAADDSSNHGCPPNRIQRAADDSSNHGCPPNRIQQAVDGSSNHGCPPNRIQQAVDDSSKHGCPPNRMQQAADDSCNGCLPNMIHQVADDSSYHGCQPEADGAAASSLEKTKTDDSLFLTARPNPGAASSEGDWEVVPLHRVHGQTNLGGLAAGASPIDDGQSQPTPNHVYHPMLNSQTELGTVSVDSNVVKTMGIKVQCLVVRPLAQEHGAMQTIQTDQPGEPGQLPLPLPSEDVAKVNETNDEKVVDDTPSDEKKAESPRERGGTNSPRQRRTVASPQLQIHPADTPPDQVTAVQYTGDAAPKD